MNAHWLERLNALLFRLRHVWAVGSFSLGLASYFLVERQPWLAAVLTAVLVDGWFACRISDRRGDGRKAEIA